MKLTSSMLILAGLLSVSLHQAVADAPTANMEAAQKRGQASNERKSVAAEQRYREYQDLKAALAKPWSSVVFACIYGCSCTGPSVFGFEITRTPEGFTATPWSELAELKSSVQAPPSMGPVIQLQSQEVERLISEATLHYLIASHSLHPYEIAGPQPRGSEATEERKEQWQIRYVEAGAPLTGGDQWWINIRICQQDGTQAFTNQYASHDYREFTDWVQQFGDNRATRVKAARNAAIRD